jgi:hypothetical protein
VTDDAPINLHLEAQTLLTQGVTKAAVEAQIKLERAICNELELNPLDRDAVDYMLNAIHEMTFEDAASRPSRLVIEGWAATRESKG